MGSTNNGGSGTFGVLLSPAPPLLPPPPQATASKEIMTQAISVWSLMGMT